MRIAALALVCLGFAAAPAGRPGGTIAYSLQSTTADGGGDLYVASAAGTARRRIVRGGSLTAGDPTWSRDGRLAYVLAVLTGDGATGSIFVVNADGTGKRRLTRGGANVGDAEPAWSPDGTTIAFQRGNGITESLWTMRADGSGVRRLTHGRYDEDPAWAPDGRRLVFAHGGALATVRADGSRERTLLRPPGNVNFRYPVWSPDGRRIAFVRIDFGDERGGGELASIHLVRADGRGNVALTRETADSNPAWSPDGRYIAFSRVPSIAALNLATGSIRVLVRPRAGYADEPAWQP